MTASQIISGFYAAGYLTAFILVLRWVLRNKLPDRYNRFHFILVAACFISFLAQFWAFADAGAAFNPIVKSFGGIWLFVVYVVIFTILKPNIVKPPRKYMKKVAFFPQSNDEQVIKIDTAQVDQEITVNGLPEYDPNFFLDHDPAGNEVVCRQIPDNQGRSTLTVRGLSGMDYEVVAVDFLGGHPPLPPHK